ncbi:hypothetical protein SK128_019955, partial [Halocaridina rubra]
MDTFVYEPDPDGKTQQVAVIMTGQVYRDAGLKHSKHPQVEGRLYDRLCVIGKHPLRDEVRRLAAHIALLVNDKEFRPTVAWLDNFMRRFCLSKKKMGFHSMNMLKAKEKPFKQDAGASTMALSGEKGLTQEEVYSALGFSKDFTGIGERGIENGSPGNVMNGKVREENGVKNGNDVDKVSQMEVDSIASNSTTQEPLTEINKLEENTTGGEAQISEKERVGKIKVKSNSLLFDNNILEADVKESSGESNKNDKLREEDDDNKVEGQGNNSSNDELEERDSSNFAEKSESESESDDRNSASEEEEEERMKSKQETSITYTRKENEYYKKNLDALQNRLSTSVIRCTSCFEQVNHQIERLVCTHPALGVFLCRRCYKYYGKGKFHKDDDGYDEYCRLCAEGGDILCCEQENCFNGFCKRCIKRVLGRSELKNAEKAKKWSCYICDPAPMTEIRAQHRLILSNLHEEEKKKDNMSRKELKAKEIKNKFALLKSRRLEKKALVESQQKPKTKDSLKDNEGKKKETPRGEPWLRHIIDSFSGVLLDCCENVQKIEEVWAKYDYTKEATAKTAKRICKQSSQMREIFEKVEKDIKKEIAKLSDVVSEDVEILENNAYEVELCDKSKDSLGDESIAESSINTQRNTNNEIEVGAGGMDDDSVEEETNAIEGNDGVKKRSDNLDTNEEAHQSNPSESIRSRSNKDSDSKEKETDALEENDGKIRENNSKKCEEANQNSPSMSTRSRFSKISGNKEEETDVLGENDAVKKRDDKIKKSEDIQGCTARSTRSNSKRDSECKQTEEAAVTNPSDDVKYGVALDRGKEKPVGQDSSKGKVETDKFAQMMSDDENSSVKEGASAENQQNAPEASENSVNTENDLQDGNEEVENLKKSLRQKGNKQDVDDDERNSEMREEKEESSPRKKTNKEDSEFDTHGSEESDKKVKMEILHSTPKKEATANKSVIDDAEGDENKGTLKNLKKECVKKEIKYEKTDSSVKVKTEDMSEEDEKKSTKTKRKSSEGKAKDTKKRRKREVSEDSDDILLGIGTSTGEEVESENENAKTKKQRNNKSKKVSNGDDEGKERNVSRKTANANKKAFSSLLASDSSDDENNMKKRSKRVSQGKKKKQSSGAEKADKTVISETSNSDENEIEKESKGKVKEKDSNDKEAKDAISDSESDLDLEDTLKPKCKKKKHLRERERMAAPGESRKQRRIKAKRMKLTEEEREDLEKQQLDNSAVVRIQRLKASVINTLEESESIHVADYPDLDNGSSELDQATYDGDAEEEEDSDREFSRLMKFDVSKKFCKPSPKCKKKIPPSDDEQEEEEEDDKEESNDGDKKNPRKNERKKKEGLLDISVDKDVDEEEEEECKKKKRREGISVNEKMKKNLLMSSDEEAESSEEDESRNDLEEAEREKLKYEKRKVKKEQESEKEEEGEEEGGEDEE